MHIFVQRPLEVQSPCGKQGKNNIKGKREKMKFVRKIKQNFEKNDRYHKALLKERRMHNRNRFLEHDEPLSGGLHAGFIKMQYRGVLSPQMPDGSCIFLRL